MRLLGYIGISVLMLIMPGGIAGVILLWLYLILRVPNNQNAKNSWEKYEQSKYIKCGANKE